MLTAVNKKNNNTYNVMGIVINATNANDGQKMVLYFCKDGNGYVRSVEEFKEKFIHDFNVDELEHVLLTPSKEVEKDA